MVAVVALVGVLVARLLSADEPFSVVTSATRTVSSGAGTLLIGLGLVTRIGATRPGRSVVVVAAVWVPVSLSALLFDVGSRTGTSPFAVSVDRFWSLARAGTAPAITVMAAVLIAGVGAVMVRHDKTLPGDAVAAVAAAGLLAEPVTGHLSLIRLGSLLIAVHVLAAAWWSGTLAALVVMNRGRAAWSRTLPQFSRWAPYAVIGVTVAGVGAAILELPSVPAVWDSAYGRLLMAKSVLLVCLVALGWWYRTRWTVRVTSHRITAGVSVRNAGIEIAVMALVFALASGLSMVPP
ncbi:copper resistance D family protein [Williamsia sterculiae]|uniref:Putative copper resistance protein D n=1 Tax=Williamsia sterculiae TaxID=1344003 RepID=A0A1N7H9I8_9NOCA|nr:CopD family protein [Williamsia sterculiae]SIS21482.1 putative copper resistance protein D [Williamsia sterculiae]